MVIRSALIGLALGAAAGGAYAQTAPSPADVGIVKQSPNVFKLLDTSKTWTPFGTVNENTHIFSPATNGPIPSGNCIKWGPGIQDAGVSCGTGTGVPAQSEADILVTDPAVGMTSGGTDNSPFVAALMTHQGGGYDVTFPSVPGQFQTVYYFSQPFVNTNNGNYHCSGSVDFLSTYLVFAPGVDGFVQRGNGGGIISGCQIISLGYGHAIANTATPTVLTSVSFAGAFGAGGLPAQSWHVGDSLILTTTGNGSFPLEAIFSVPLGTTITAVNGTTGDLTMSNPVTQSLGGTFRTRATATFTQTGTNNFQEGDLIHVGPNTYRFTALGIVGHGAPGYVLLGANFAASAANLVSAITGGAGQYTTYYPWDTGAGAFGPDLLVTASYASGVITFTSNYGPPNANAYPSVYTAAGTSAGSFGGATFSGAADSASNMLFYQLPAAQRFKVRTTVGSAIATIVSGPRLLNSGDVVWSDAFRFGSTVGRVDSGGTVGAQTIHMGLATNLGGDDSPATVTHAPGAEGNLWIVPAGIKRTTEANSYHNNLFQWPIGLEMSCSSAGDANCDGSVDERNAHDFDFVGRWVAGNNTSTASSKDDQFSINALMDVWEGGTLGEIYYNIDAESIERGASRFGIVMNCANQNYSMIFGGYIGGGPGCTYDGFNFPATYGGISILAALSTAPAGSLASVNHNIQNGVNFVGGPDFAQCASLSGPVNVWWMIAFSFNGCAITGNMLAMSWQGFGTWAWTMGGPTATPFMEFLNTGWGYTGYTSPNGQSVFFQQGVLLSDADGSHLAHLFSMSDDPAPPVTGVRQAGDVVINTSSTAGGVAAGFYKAGATWLPVAPIANDAAGTHWTLGNYLTLTPVALASLPATCTAGTFAVINNGVASPTYNAAVGATTGAATDPVFCTAGNVWAYH